MTGTVERKTSQIYAVSLIALILSGIGLVAAFAGPAPNPTAPPARTVEITMTVGEGLVVSGWNNTCQCAVAIDTPAADTEKVIGEYVRWEPSALVINKGDTVRLTVKNPRGGDHSFTIESGAGSFTGTTSVTVQGRENSGNPAGTQSVIEFTALKAGTYTFICAIPYDDEAHKCHPDHETLTGTLIVV